MDSSKRRPHRKSQFGCMQCRQRRVKCSETIPACDHCVKRGVECVYPQRAHLTGQPNVTSLPRAANSPGPLTTTHSRGSPSSSVSSTHATRTFGVVDMKMFHHFIMHAYPHVPEGNDHAWTTEIPAIAFSEEVCSPFCRAKVKPRD